MKNLAVCLIVAAIFISSCSIAASAQEVTRAKLQMSISRALDFLSARQLPYGEFKTYTSRDPQMNGVCHFDSSPFITSFVVYSLSFVDDQRARNMTRKALDFFLEEKEGPGLWRYWASRDHKDIVPDMDDTACVSYILKANNIPVDANLEAVLANRNIAGLFYTWFGLPAGLNDVDCAVNANAVFYLGESADTKAACDYLSSLVLNGKENRCSRYYPDPLAFYYLFSRAYLNSAPSLGSVKDKIIERVSALQEENGSFGNDLSTALALCTLLNFRQRSLEMDKAVAYLLEAQRQDGSWDKSAFFIGTVPFITVFSGSEELTTAFCIEALARIYERY